LRERRAHRGRDIRVSGSTTKIRMEFDNADLILLKNLRALPPRRLSGYRALDHFPNANDFDAFGFLWSTNPMDSLCKGY